MKLPCFKDNSVSPEQQSRDIDNRLREERESKGIRTSVTENYLNIGVAQSNIHHEYAAALKLANNETFAAKAAIAKKACCSIL